MSEVMEDRWPIGMRTEAQVSGTSFPRGFSVPFVLGHKLLQFFKVDLVGFGLIGYGEAHIILGWAVIRAAVVWDFEITHTAVTDGWSAAVGAARYSAGEAQLQVRTSPAIDGVCSATAPSVGECVNRIGLGGGGR